MTEANVLLVEGPDESHFFYHLSIRHNIHKQFIIKYKEGIDNLLRTLEGELVASELERLGVVVDADTNLASRWDALRDRLRRAGYSQIPAVPDPNGTIIEQDEYPIVGIWVMPDNKLSGMLENFASFLISPDDVLWDRAIACIEQIPQKERLFPSEQLIKAHLHTWLAWQEEPGRPMGQAIRKGFLNPNAPHAQQLIAWLRRLFDL